MSYKGNTAIVQAGTETTWGTEVDATEVLNLSSVDLDLNVTKIEDESLMANISSTGKDVTGYSASGSISGNLKPDNAKFLFKHAFGVKNSSAHTTPGVYKHVFTPVASNASLPSFTTEVDKGPSVKVYTGCKIGSFGLSAKAQGYIEYSADIKAKNETTGTLTSGLSKPTKKIYLASGGVFTIGAVNVAGLVDSFSFDVNNNVDEGTYTFGSGMTPNEMKQGKREYTVSFEGYFDTTLDTVRDDLLKSGDVTDLNLTFLSPTEIGATGEFERFDIDLPNVTIDEAKISISGPDYIKVSFKGTALQVGSTSPATITLYNGEAS